MASLLEEAQEALSNIGRSSPTPLAITVPTQVWLLLGISTTSLVGSPLLKSNKMRQSKTNEDFFESMNT